MNRGALGFGGAVGLGLAVSLLIAVIAVGRGVLRHLTGATSVVITFAEVAVCTLLGGIVFAVLGVLAYRWQLARIDLAGRRLALEQAARHLEAPADVAELLEAPRRAVSQAPQRLELGEPARTVPAAERNGRPQ